MKKRVKYFIFILLMVFVYTMSSYANETPYLLKYDGKINDMEIYMEINVEENNLDGFYFYKKYKKNIELKGSIEHFEKVILKEYYNDSLTGIFKGKIKSDNIIDGVWASSDGERKYPFEISLTSMDEIKEGFYGVWKITNIVTTAPIYAMDEEEMKSFIGKEIVYMKNIFWFKHDEYKDEKYFKPEYKIEIFSEMQFWENHKGFYLDEVGITKGLVITVDIKKSKERTYINNPGSSFWIKDKNTLFILWDGVYFEVKRDLNDDNISYEEKINLIGLDKISDIELKNSLVKYLYYESILDYENVYKYLSKNFLQEHFPDIKNAKEYKNEMVNTSEALETDYLQLIDHKKLKNDLYQVDLILETNIEGSIEKIKMRYYFVFEKDIWKYNGLDIDFMKVLE